MVAINHEESLNTIIQAHLTDLEEKVGALCSEDRGLWPTIHDLFVSGELGRYIVKIIALLRPIITYVEEQFPAYKALIEWILNIINAVSAFQPLMS